MAASDRTKQALALALKELMASQPLEKISVGDIAAQAQMGRNTFYYHFKDKYDLVNWIFETECGSLMKAPGNMEETEESMLMVEKYLKDNIAFYRNALEYSGQNCLQEYIYEMLERRLTEMVQEQNRLQKAGMQEDDVHFAAVFFANALQGMLVRGIRFGRPGEANRFRECVRRLSRGKLLDSYINDAWKEQAEEK